MGQLLDRPLWRDWIVWLWAVMLVPALTETFSGYAGASSSTFNGVALAVDVLIAVGVTTAVFLWLPAKIRQAFRARRQSS